MKRGLSKVQISMAEEKSRTMETVRCSICDEVSAKSVLMRVCDSGHWARHTFQPDPVTPQETSNTIAGLVQCCSNITVSRFEAVSLQNKDFAGGDQHHCCKCFRAIPQSKSLNNMDEKPTRASFSYPEEVKCMNNNTTETTIKYKNDNFRESESLLSVNGLNEHETKNGQEKCTDVMHRPITCPISDCRKKIARASILQHFVFDHSKIPRITLNVDKLQRVLINVSAITKEIRCYAILLAKLDGPLVHTVDCNTLMNGGHKNASFLLMGVRMQSAEIIKKPHGSKCVSIRHAQTQTEAPTKSFKVCLEPTAVKDSIVGGGADRYFDDHRDVILLWICKLVHDITFLYTISVRRPDMKLGYSFTGETLNIGDFHELPMFQQVECLCILEKASIKLMNEQYELEVTVNIFK